MKYMILLAVLFASLTAHSQTSKDSLILKMHRNEWRASLDTLSAVIPHIGRSRNADEADKLQQYMMNVLNRMASRLDTIPRKRPNISSTP